MIKTAFAGLLLVPVFIILQPNQKAGAMEISLATDLTTTHTQLLAVATFPAPELVEKSAAVQEAVKPRPQPETYTVSDHDSLVKIAEKYETTWKRIFDKNLSVSHPDLINPGDVLVIPDETETLAERTLPDSQKLTPFTSPAKKSITRTAVARPAAAPRPITASTSSGNGYVAGYCTWYVKNRRPSLPNNLGNADTWVSRAAALGMATGSVPRAGAVGQRGMHVVYVESVNTDGTVNISEMNHKGLYVISHRTLPANYFMYIY